LLRLQFFWEVTLCQSVSGSQISEKYGRRWEDNIKRDLQKVGGGCGDWMKRAQDRDRWRALVSTVMNFRVP
jgi:hypothetical protein